MDNKKRFIINMSAQTLSFIINIGINFFLSGYIVNVIGKEVYGFVGLANNFVSYVQVFTVAFNTMLSRFVTIKLVKQEYEDANKYLTSVTFCNIFISIILFIPSVLLCYFLEYVIKVPKMYVEDIKLLWFLIFMGFLIQLSTNTFQTSFFATNRLDLSAKRSLENYLLRAGMLAIFFSFLEPHVWYVGLTTCICAVFLAILNKYYMKKLTPQLLIKKTFFSIEAVKELVGVGVWNSINQLSQLLITGFDLLITNVFIGASEMGMLSISKTIPTQLLAFVSMVSNVFFPRMTIIYASGDKDTFLKETGFSMRMCGAICSVPIIGFIAYGSSFYRLWMSSLSEQEIIQVQILSILTLLPTIFSVYIYPLYNVNTITCKLKIPVLVSAGIGMANLGIVYVLLHSTNLGIYAVAGVSSVLLLFRVLLFAPMYAAKNLKLKILTFYPPLARGILANFLMLMLFKLIIYSNEIKSWIELIVIAIISGVLGYIINYYVVFNQSERQKVMALLQKKVKKLRKK